MSNTEALRAAAQQALVALVHHTDQTRPIQRTADAIAALRAVLAEPAASGEPAKPVAWAQLGMRNGHTYVRMHYEGHLYPPPPDVQRNLNLVPLYATAQPAPALVPPGWVLAPLEPTPEMLAVNVDPGEYVSIEAARILWRAMLAAAPDAQKGAA